MITYCDNTLDLSPYHSSSKNEKAVVITTVSCCLSILGAVGIFVTFYMMKEIRNFVRSLMVCLTMADFCTATGYLVATLRHYGNQEDKVSCELCIIQSFITTFSSLVSFFLTMFIALHIFLTIYNVRPVTGTGRFLFLFNGISVIIPGTIVVVAFFCNVLGQDVTSTKYSQAGTGPWCWIHVNRTTEGQQYNSTANNTGGLDSKTIMWMTLTGKGWEILCYLVTTTLYVLLKLHLYLKHRHRQFKEIHDSLRNEDKNYIMVFLVLYLIRIWGTLRFFINASPKSSESVRVSDFLENLQAFGDPSQAFFNFCLFCLLDRTVRRKMFDFLLSPLRTTRNREMTLLGE